MYKYICVLLFALMVFFSTSVKAEDMSEVEFEVNHVAKGFEKFKEKALLFFKFSKDDKYKYQKFLLEKRLAELKYVIDSKEWDPIETTSSRYTSYLGRFHDSVVKSNLKGVNEEVLSIYERHGKVLRELQKNFEFEGGWWLLLQHDINSTKIFSEKLK
ncbi:MAG: Uncharacterized protein G01um101493_117 [Microgenomates group bacterium Gr01-1014_93]|nr:MAG: Uncharacterized protein G01um101493_117 [Microgenomates group bacterium Gr01-1014_93]